MSVLLETLARARSRAGAASAPRHGAEVLSFERLLSRVEERIQVLAEPRENRFVTLDSEDPIAFLVDFLAARLAARPALSICPRLSNSIWMPVRRVRRIPLFARPKLLVCLRDPAPPRRQSGSGRRVALDPGALTDRSRMVFSAPCPPRRR